MRRRIKVISGLVVGSAAAGLAGLVAYKVRQQPRRGHVRRTRTRRSRRSARSGDVTVICSCGQPNCEHMHAAAVVAAAQVPRNGSHLWHALRTRSTT